MKILCGKEIPSRFDCIIMMNFLQVLSIPITKSWQAKISQWIYRFGVIFMSIYYRGSGLVGVCATNIFTIVLNEHYNRALDKSHGMSMGYYSYDFCRSCLSI